MNLDSALESVIRDISAGIYTSRVRVDDPDPGARHTADQVNRLLDIVADTIKKTNQEISSEQRQTQYLLGNLKAVSDTLEKISGGDVGCAFQIQGTDNGSPEAQQQFAVIRTSITAITSAVSSLHQDVTALTGWAGAGDLDHTIDTSGYTGTFRQIADGLNQTLNQVNIPLREILRVSARYAVYDFQARFDPALRISGNWISFRDSFDNIGTLISDAFGSINRQVMELSANAEQANASVTEVANSSEQVARNSDAVSQNTEQSDAGVRQVLRAMEDLSVTVGEVSQKAESVSRIAQESTSLSREGSEFARKAEEGMGVITRSAGDVDVVIGEIQQEMKKINEIVRLITEIANQTNLLALNAAIEAARAGEMGRGFAVVAAEVKALALESRQSAEKITDMILNLQRKSQTASDAVSSTSAAVKDGNVMLSDTLRIFGQLVTSVEDISTNIEQVASMNEEQAAAVEEITSSMHEVSAMLKDTAKEAVDSAHATSETSVSVNQLRVIVDQVAGIAETISGSMARFRL